MTGISFNIKLFGDQVGFVLLIYLQNGIKALICNFPGLINIEVGVIQRVEYILCISIP